MRRRCRTRPWLRAGLLAGLSWGLALPGPAAAGARRVGVTVSVPSDTNLAQTGVTPWGAWAAAGALTLGVLAMLASLLLTRRAARA